MSQRYLLSLIAIVCLLLGAFLFFAQPSNGALVLFAAGVIAALWAWFGTSSAPPIVEAGEETRPVLITSAPAANPPTAAPADERPPVSSDAPPASTEVVVAASIEVAKPRDTTEVLPQIEEDSFSLSAEEMAILKPPTTKATSSFDDAQLEEAVRKATTVHAEKVKDDTNPNRAKGFMRQERDPDATEPMRPEIIPANLSAEEMAIQKPSTPHATESFDDDAVSQAILKAKARARTRQSGDIVSAEQMATEKPETDASTRKISRDMLPPTSTTEMASKKPPSEVSTHEIEATVEAEAIENPLPEAAANMADEKPSTPLSTIEEAIEPGTLPIDTPLIEMPSPAMQMMEVDATPKEKDRPSSDTLEVVTDEDAINQDDLERIEGIGPKISSLLIAAGISTFSRLATTPEEELRDILKQGGVRMVSNISTWAEQAAIASRGDWDALKAYQDEMGTEE